MQCIKHYVFTPLKKWAEDSDDSCISATLSKETHRPSKWDLRKISKIRREKF
jgi:hypothetical protein